MGTLLTEIPVQQLISRRLHLGPFVSGRALIKFLGIATLGAAVAALTSVVVWLPFLGVGVVLAFLPVEGRPLDEFVTNYCRYCWRTLENSGPHRPGPRGADAQGGSDPHRPALRAGGIPVAYLPPAELEQVFHEWRAALLALDYPLTMRVGGERISPLPFLPPRRRAHGPERTAMESYRELIRALLRPRFRRVVDLTFWADRDGPASVSVDHRVQADDLVSRLTHLGVPNSQDAGPSPRGASAGRLQR